MARIRSVKPELRRSVNIAQWPREVRYAFMLLWGYCDDAGRGVDDPRAVASDLFPLSEDADVTPAKMERWLELMAGQPLDPHDEPALCRYEVRGRKYLHVVKWHHQKINRPSPSRLPPCPEHHEPDEPVRDLTGGYQ